MAEEEKKETKAKKEIKMPKFPEQEKKDAEEQLHKPTVTPEWTLFSR